MGYISILSPLGVPILIGAGITLAFQPWLVIPLTQAIVEAQIETIQRLLGQDKKA